MASNNDALGEMLNQMLPNIINDSALGPFVSMSRMLDIVVKRNSFRGCRYDDSSLFPDELIAHFRKSGHAVDNAHRLTLILGNQSSLTLHILAEAPGSEAFVRYKLVYTDGSISSESKIGYGSHALTAERFDDMVTNFELHRPVLTRKLDELALHLNRRQLERQIFEQALPIFVANTVPQHGYPYRLVMNSQDSRHGAFLDIRLNKKRMIRLFLRLDNFESQLTSIGECLTAIDPLTTILTDRELETRQLHVLEYRELLPKADQDKVTFNHFVHRSGELLKETLGSGCFKICYLKGLSAELYLALADNLWLKAKINKSSYMDDIDHATEKRTEIMRMMAQTNLTFSIGKVKSSICWTDPGN